MAQLQWRFEALWALNLWPVHSNLCSRNAGRYKTLEKTPEVHSNQYSSGRTERYLPAFLPQLEISLYEIVIHKLIDCQFMRKTRIVCGP